jgi:hypothetical protein
MKIFFLCLYCFLFFSGNCQILQRSLLTTKDSVQGILFKYEYEAKGSYGTITLILNKDNTYSYQKSSFAVEGISEGKWKIIRNRLILKSTLQKNIPIKISYGTDGDFADGSNIAVVENIDKEPLTDVTVLVNNDSIECLPLTGQCTGSFKSIKKVKAVFENGLSSKWINVKDGETKILLTILSEIPIENYVIMHNKKFTIEDNNLSPD